MRRRLIIAGAALAALLAAFAGGVGVGRSSRPAREETKTQATSSAQAVAHEQEQRTEAPVRVVTRRVLVPCPPVPAATPATAVVEERTEERGPVVIVRTTDASSSTTASSTTSTVIIREQPRWLVGVDAEWTVAHLAPSSFSPTWGGQVMYRIAGPLWVGAGASLAGDVRAQVALTF